MLKAVIWCRDNCVYCSLAEKELYRRDYKIEKRNINHIWSKEDLQKVVPDVLNRVPSVMLLAVFTESILIAPSASNVK